MTRRGVTLLELLIYIVLFGLVASLVAEIFVVASRNARQTAAAYAVSGQTDTALRIIRQDLQETALTSVRVYSNNNSPLASMISAREMDTERLQGKLLISEYGVPRWRKHIFYAYNAGNLVRWEVALPAAEQNRLPKLAVRPTAIPGSARIIVRGIVAPRAVVKGLGAGSYTASDWGGFRMQFLRRMGGPAGAEVLVDVNPGLNKAAPADNTRLVEVELAITEDVGNPPNFYRVKFRVGPRY